VDRFSFQLEPELLRLRRELLAGTWVPGRLVHFRIDDPKPRLISAAPFRDRVVHHAVMDVMEPCFERWFDDDSYACRKGRGVDAALSRAVVLSRRSAVILRSDISACFASIDHGVLMDLLRQRFRDAALLALLERIIDHGGAGGKGLPIGSLTSQWLANLVLDALDRFVRSEIRPAGYLRYMDDFAIFGQQSDELRAVRDRLAEWTGEHLHLRLNPRVTQIYSTRNGWPFLGFRVRPSGLRLRRDTWKRFRRRLGRKHHLLRRGLVSADELQQAASSMLAHVDRARSRGLRRATLRVCEL
jgi:retron-type reverse transcriptase